MVVEVAVLIARPGRRAVRTTIAPALFPLRLLAVALRRRLPRDPDDPARLPGRLRDPGARQLRRRGQLALSWLPTEPVVLGGIALTLSYGAYVSEVYRAGLRSVHRGQRDAALAVGLTERQAMRHVVLPQAVRNVGPPLLNDFISLQKDVALISIIGVTGEAFRIAQIQASSDFNYTPLLARRCSTWRSRSRWRGCSTAGTGGACDERRRSSRSRGSPRRSATARC